MRKSRRLLSVTAIASSFLLATIAVASGGCGGSSNNNTAAKDSGVAVDTGTVEMDSGMAVDTGNPNPGMDSGAPETSTMMTCPVADGGFPAGYPAAHAPFPTVVYQGGGIIETPEVVTITFPGDSLGAQLEQFGDDVLQTCYWDAVRAPFCEMGTTGCMQRGATPSGVDHVQVTTAPSATYTDAQIQQFLQGLVANGTAPPPNGNRIYVIYFPQSVTISDQGLGTSCQNFGGYHAATSVAPMGGNTANVPYAVVPECPPFGFNSLLDSVTYDASHEITEAATDPFSSLNQTGFYLDFGNSDNDSWNFLAGGEVGDLCVDLLGPSQKKPIDRFSAVGAHGTYVVQRMWSPVAAGLGGDPCVPYTSMDEPYFNLAIAQGADLQRLSVGGSVTIEADAFSTDPSAGTWGIGAIDWTAEMSGQTPPLTITPSKTSVTNGDKISVTLTLNSAPLQPIAQGVNGEVFILYSANATAIHVWAGLVVGQ
jgi:hypothetical protein